MVRELYVLHYTVWLQQLQSLAAKQCGKFTFFEDELSSWHHPILLGRRSKQFPALSKVDI